jgi:hypothetical protein
LNELGAHHDRAPTGCCTSARRTSPEPDCDTPDSGNERQQWNARSPLGRLDSAVSKIVGIRRGQSAAEELAVPDSYFAGADRGRPFSIFHKQSVGPRLFVDAIREDRPLRPDFGDGHAVQCVVEAALRTERTSMGFAPGAELSVLRRRS